MVKHLILAASLVGFAPLAGAQPVHDGVSSHPDDAVAAEGPVAGSSALPARAHLDLPGVGDLLKLVIGERPVRRWLDPAFFRVAPARFAVRANPGLPSIRRKINRRVVPIPLLRWQWHSALFTPRGFTEISPSIVIGRRLTWAPDLARGGRTIGVAVQVRLWLDGAPASSNAPVPAQAPARILSTVRTMLDRR